MTRRFSPRRVYLLLPVREDVAAALRADGHEVFSYDAVALLGCDTLVVVGPASPLTLYYAGSAKSRGALVLYLREGDAPAFPRAGAVTATASSVAELVDLVGRWDPVALTFVSAGPAARYRHRETGEVRERVPAAIGGTLKLRSDDGHTLVTVVGDPAWERLERGSER